jgi:pimeloyl-ACP methyl ester carboxylesterase
MKYMLPTLTGIGARKHLLTREIDLDTHIQDVIGVIDDADLSDIVVVGHSYGGMLISGVADRVPERVASLVYLDAFVPENGQSLFSVLPPNRRLTTVPGEDWLVAPIPSAGFGLKRPDVIVLWEAKSAYAGCIESDLFTVQGSMIPFPVPRPRRESCKAHVAGCLYSLYSSLFKK